MTARRCSGGPICGRRPRFLAALALAALAAALAGCGGSGESGSGNPEPPAESADLLFVGEWRVYSERIDFDAGGGNTIDPVTRELNLNEDGTWEFGSSGGTWYVTSIDAGDWADWGVEAYGPERKMVLEGWNDDIGDGPIEESAGGVDFFWVIYHVDEPEPGTIQLKFGHP